MASGDPIPVLWLCGPPGVGKTAVAWEVYSRVRASGVHAGYVDIDQLGICHPEPASDPGRHRTKARNLGAVVSNLEAAGARCVVVSGVVSATAGVPVDEMPRAALTVCRLRADGEELERRLVRREGTADLVAGALREAEALDASDVAGVCVDTSGVGVSEVAGRVRERTGGWPGAPAGVRRAAPLSGTTATDAGGRVLWLCGATGVGKSAVGFTVYQETVRAGVPAAYVDLDQLGFCSVADHRLRASNLASLWRTYRAAGAERLVVTGPAEDASVVSAYRDALPAATVTTCRLHAGYDELERRVRLRGEGGGWAQPGDPLTGRSADDLRRVAERSATEAAALDRMRVGDVRVCTDARTVREVADLVVAGTGWRLAS